jgi:hypothetical protein
VDYAFSLGCSRQRARMWAVFARMMEGFASEAAVPKTVMIDATYPLPGSGLLANHEGVKAHRTASSLG